MPLELSAYQSAWAERFELWRQWLRDALGSRAVAAVVSIEHVGSTSIPPLNCAKPILDIDIIVAKDNLSEILDHMEHLGCVKKGTQGIEDRYALTFQSIPNDRCGAPPQHKANVYIIVDGSVALQNHRLLKQVLMSSPVLAERYASKKRELAASTDDMAQYCQGKTDIILEILREGGMSEESTRLIEACNR